MVTIFTLAVLMVSPSVWAASTEEELVQNYVESGKLKIVMRENPIESIHPAAVRCSQFIVELGN